jgi:hypothetical protein
VILGLRPHQQRAGDHQARIGVTFADQGENPEELGDSLIRANGTECQQERTGRRKL